MEAFPEPVPVQPGAHGRGQAGRLGADGDGCRARPAERGPWCWSRRRPRRSASVLTDTEIESLRIVVLDPATDASCSARSGDIPVKLMI